MRLIQRGLSVLYVMLKVVWLPVMYMFVAMAFLPSRHHDAPPSRPHWIMPWVLVALAGSAEASNLIAPVSGWIQNFTLFLTTDVATGLGIVGVVVGASSWFISRQYGGEWMSTLLITGIVVGVMGFAVTLVQLMGVGGGVVMV